MQVIPVLDLLDGHVVRAVRGERTNYLPIRSALAATSAPVPIARALLAASGARTLYIADLGAILQRAAHAATLAALRAALPGTEIWLDAGYADYAAMQALFARIEQHVQHVQHTQHAHHAHHALATLVPVFGTESLREAQALRSAEDAGLAPVLSFDHHAGKRLAASDLAFAPAVWPGRVIAMTLDRVGSYDGPDFATFDSIRADAPTRTAVIGAGGIRHHDDVAAADRAGASAWLVASALHDGRIGVPLADPAGTT